MADALTHASIHASCSPSPEVFSTSLFAIAIIARASRLCDSGALGSGRLSFGLKYVPGHGHAQKKLHYVFNFIQKSSVLSKIFHCAKLLADENINFVSLIFVGPHPYENILTTKISRITVHATSITKFLKKKTLNLHNVVCAKPKFFKIAKLSMHN